MDTPFRSSRIPQAGAFYLQYGRAEAPGIALLVRFRRVQRGAQPRRLQREQLFFSVMQISERMFPRTPRSSRLQAGRAFSGLPAQDRKIHPRTMRKWFGGFTHLQTNRD